MSDDAGDSGRGGGGRGRGRGGRSRGGGGWRGGGRGGHHSHDSPDTSQTPATTLPPLSSLTPLQRSFASFSLSLDAHNDKRERVYQLARDLIKAAKRVIFILQRPLHSSSSSPSPPFPSSSPTPSDSASLIPPTLVNQAEHGLQEVYACFHQINEELARDTDIDLDDASPTASPSSVLASSVFRYSAAYSFAVQEYVEAVSFLHFLTTRSLIPFAHVERLISRHTAQPFTLLPADYLLGILDLPGEVMRFATNNLSTSLPHIMSMSAFLQTLHRQVSGLTLRPWAAYSGKLNVLVECVEKLERLHYRMEMRVPSHTQRHTCEQHTQARARTRRTPAPAHACPMHVR